MNRLLRCAVLLSVTLIGCAQLPSDSELQYVDFGTGAGGNARPVITTSPQGDTVSAGAAITLTVAATGTPAPTYQWYLVRNGTWTAIANATSSSYSVSAAQASDSGIYYVIATNVAGSDTSSGAHVALKTGSRPLFTVTFSSGALKSTDQGWVIVHSLDGSGIDTSAYLSGDGTLDMSSANYDQVTFTILIRQFDGTSYSNYGYTLYAAPRTAYALSGAQQELLVGHKSFRVSFPSAQYTDIEVDGIGFGTSASVAQPTTMSSKVVSTDDFYSVNGLYSILAVALNKATVSGYWGWVLDQPVPAADTIAVNADKRLNPATFSSSRPINRVALDLCKQGSPIQLGVYGRYSDTLRYSLQVPEPSVLPGAPYSLLLTVEGGDTLARTSYSYALPVTSIPTSITIPTGTVNGIANLGAHRIEGISASGTPDMLMTMLYSRGVSNWIIFAPPTAISLTVPALPASVKTLLGATYLDSLDFYGVVAIDCAGQNGYGAVVGSLLAPVMAGMVDGPPGSLEMYSATKELYTIW